MGSKLMIDESVTAAFDCLPLDRKIPTSMLRHDLATTVLKGYNATEYAGKVVLERRNTEIYCTDEILI